MILNAEQILEQKLLKLDNTKGKPSQVGYDLSLKSVNKVGNPINSPGVFYNTEYKIGKVLKNKTELTTYTPLNIIQLDGVEGWLLYPGTYDITFWEGCKIPNNLTAFIKQRSSLYRNGATINSPVFDSGFETENMGTIMLVNEPIFIEKDARVAQIYFHENTPVGESNLYNGQFQNDQQRK
jgi:deoxycytidine triphosphate deaminase